jgi:flavin reductase (DIM6/NTAB) family NADH-FMN oxidoreductase RutF
MTQQHAEELIDFSQIDIGARYKLMVDLIVPRPIAFVSTRGADGSQNLAPYSFFNGVSSEPPCVVISCSSKRGGILKDTLRNIIETREFVVNGCSEEMIEAVHQTSFDYEYGIDELEKVGLRAVPSTRVRPVRVAEAPWSLECELHQLVDVGERGSPGSSVLIIGKILIAHHKLSDWKPLSRLGGPWYGSTQNFKQLERAKKIE